MRRHGPVIAHCTDSEDFPPRLNLHKFDRQNVLFVIIKPIFLAATEQIFWVASWLIRQRRLAEKNWQWRWRRLRGLWSTHSSVCDMRDLHMS